MPITVTRVFEFDAAHRVLGHESKCRFFHGHRYKTEITFERIDDTLDDIGRVIDFGVLKSLVGKEIDDLLDHTSILNSDDPLVKVLRLDAFRQGSLGVGLKEPYVMTLGNPTAENIAEELGTIIIPRVLNRAGLEKLMRVSWITLYETPNCSVDWHPHSES